MRAYECLVINPSPSSIIPQPSILEEPPIPVGFQVDLQPAQQQQQPSISLVLPTKSDSIDSKKSVAGAEDTLSTLSQQEELSVKGMYSPLLKFRNSLCLFSLKSGREQRHLLMQKLNQRRLDSPICLIRNMVSAADIDDELQQDVTGSRSTACPSA